MVAKIVRILSVCLVLVLLADVQPALCDGWSLPNPFSSDKDKADAKKPAPKPAPKAVKKQPSTLDKVGADTKQFFTKVGDTLTFKKSEPKKTSPWPYAPAEDRQHAPAEERIEILVRFVVPARGTEEG